MFSYEPQAGSYQRYTQRIYVSCKNIRILLDQTKSAQMGLLPIEVSGKLTSRIFKQRPSSLLDISKELAFSRHSSFDPRCDL